MNELIEPGKRRKTKIMGHGLPQINADGYLNYYRVYSEDRYATVLKC
jgi:hypothetical protein